MRYSAARTAVIIATRNRPESLNQTLRSLALQTKPPRQIIVVSSSDSHNRTRELRIGAEIRSRLPDVRFLRVHHINKAHNLNIALRYVRPGISLVAFTDDDCIVPPGWVAGMAETHTTHAEAAIVTGPCISLQPQYLPRVYSIMATPPGNSTVPYPFVFGGNMSIKRNVLGKRHGWFHEAFMHCEDFELSQRVKAMGLDTILVPRLVVVTTYPDRFIPFYVRAYEHGKYEYLVNEIYHTALKDQYTPGTRHPVLRGILNIPGLVTRLSVRFYRERRYPWLIAGYLTFECAKVLGMWSMLIRYHADATFRRTYANRFAR